MAGVAGPRYNLFARGARDALPLMQGSADHPAEDVDLVAGRRLAVAHADEVGAEVVDLVKCATMLRDV